MKDKLKLILLVDDNKDDNFFHKKAIEKADAAEEVAECVNGLDALDFLLNRGNYEGIGKSYPRPDLIFLDINMPKMNGWEFLEEYEKLSDDTKGGPVVVMLTTSVNPRDREKMKKFRITKDFLSKPLTESDVRKIVEEYIVK
ncbi:response regulator [Ekhidna sp.]